MVHPQLLYFGLDLPLGFFRTLLPTGFRWSIGWGRLWRAWGSNNPSCKRICNCHDGSQGLAPECTARKGGPLKNKLEERGDYCRPNTRLPQTHFMSGFRSLWLMLGERVGFWHYYGRPKVKVLWLPTSDVLQYQLSRCSTDIFKFEIPFSCYS